MPFLAHYITVDPFFHLSSIFKCCQRVSLMKSDHDDKPLLFDLEFSLEKEASFSELHAGTVWWHIADRRNDL